MKQQHCGTGAVLTFVPFLTNKRPAEGAQELFKKRKKYQENIFGIHLFIYARHILTIYLV